MKQSDWDRSETTIIRRRFGSDFPAVTSSTSKLRGKACAVCARDVSVPDPNRASFRDGKPYPWALLDRGGLMFCSIRCWRGHPKDPAKSPLKKLIDKRKTEAQIQEECCTVLDTSPCALVYSITDASRSFGKDGKPRKSKVRKDWPDITMLMGWPCPGISPGRFVGIEVKRPGEKQTEGQRKIQLEIESCHGIYWLVHSAEELKEKLERGVL